MYRKTRRRVPKIHSKFSPKEFDYFETEALGLPKIDSLFLVISYDRKYVRIEKAIKNFFNGVYTVHMARDCMGNLLEGICEKIQESNFGIVVFAGLKKYKRRGRGRKKYCFVKLNIPFEYGMLQVLNKPVLLICEEKLNLDIRTEFSDISNIQHGEKIRVYKQQARIERRVGEIFKKFIPELAKGCAKMAILEGKNFKKLSHRKAREVQLQAKKIYEVIIRNEFKDKVH